MAAIPVESGRHRAEEFAGDLGVIRASWDSLLRPPPRAASLPRVLSPGALVPAALIVLLAAIAVAAGLRSCGL